MDFARTDARVVSAAFSYSEALVLFDLLHRWEEAEGGIERLTADPGELRVLWDLSAALEPIVDEAFSIGYDEVIRAARAEVADPA